VKKVPLQNTQEQENQHLLVKIKSHIHSARVRSARLIQKWIHELYWKIGLSSQNPWNMRQFRVEYDDQPKLQQLVGEIPWGHNMVLIDVEYALRGIEKPIGVAEYRLTKTLPQSIRKHLPGANVFKLFLKEERK